jgi:hypothetical protein
LRLTAIIGGVIVPALVSLSINDKLDIKVGGIAFVVSLLVAISVAVEGFFNYDERWRHYRRTVEGLKIEGWRFFQLSGPYRRYRSHRAAYSTFADRIEGIIRQELEVYITKVVQEREQEREESETS